MRVLFVSGMDFAFSLNKRYKFVISVFFVILLLILFGSISNNTPQQKISLSIRLLTSPLPATRTCLDTYDTKERHRSDFRSASVNYSYPVTVDYWVRGKTGFEIGGPSIQAWGALGVYDQATKMDIGNYAASSLWESGVKDGAVFMWKNQSKGVKYIRDATNLAGLPANFYDFFLASDVIEHIANPFKALLEWIRILKPGGYLLIIAPFSNVTFDHKRSITPIEHLIGDYRNQTSEADLSHLDEILQLHDLEKDYPAGGFDAFKFRSQNNLIHRALHQHVFDHELLYHIYTCLCLKVEVQYTWHYHQLIIGQKK